MVLDPGLGLRDAKSNEERRRQCRNAAEIKEWSPPMCWRNDIVCGGRQDKPNRITLLQKPAEDAAMFCRNFFHRQRDANAPLTAHHDSEDPAQDQKDRKIWREPGAQLHDSEQAEVHDHGDASAIAV